MSRRRFRRPVQSDEDYSHDADTVDPPTCDVSTPHVDVGSNWRWWIGSGLGIAMIIFAGLLVVTRQIAPDDRSEDRPAQAVQEKPSSTRELSLRSAPQSDQARGQTGTAGAPSASARSGLRTPPAMAPSMPQLAIPAGPNDPWAGGSSATGRSQWSSVANSPPAITPPIVPDSRGTRAERPQQFGPSVPEDRGSTTWSRPEGSAWANDHASSHATDPYSQHQHHSEHATRHLQPRVSNSALEQPLPAETPRWDGRPWAQSPGHTEPAQKSPAWGRADRLTPRSGAAELLPAGTSETADSSPGLSHYDPSPANLARIPPQAAPGSRPAGTGQTASNSASTSWGRQPAYRSGRASPTRSYVVQAGETVFDIARRQLGEARRWVEIVELNPNTFRAGPSSLEQLTPGTTLLLPANDSSTIRW